MKPFRIDLEKRTQGPIVPIELRPEVARAMVDAIIDRYNSLPKGHPEAATWTAALNDVRLLTMDEMEPEDFANAWTGTIVAELINETLERQFGIDGSDLEDEEVN